MKKIFKILIVMGLTASLLSAQNSWATASGDSGTGSAAPSVNQSANTAKDKNDSGKDMSMMTAAMYAAMAAMEAAQCPTNSSACALAALHAGMAALSMMQAGEHDKKAKMSAATATDTNATGTTDTLGGTSGSASVNPQTADMKKLTAGIGGVKADFRTGTVSVKGKEYPASSFSSPGAMAAAGFGADQIASALSVVDKVNKKVEAKYGALTGTNGFEDGSGGGGGIGSSSSGDSVAGAGPATGPGLGLGDRNPAQVAGMQKDFNGEPIGVAADSIFEMMNRRYKYKDRQNAFIDENDLLMQK